ncbi:MAG TPA: T9SS type A sorting domain-containing protein, partial [Chitinophagaceae bacterium]
IGGIFPNPATSLVNVIIDAPRRDDVTIVVMDALGKTLKQKLVNVETGSNTVAVEISGLAAGSYLLKVVSRSSDGESTVSKFVKQ